MNYYSGYELVELDEIYKDLTYDIQAQKRSYLIPRLEELFAKGVFADQFIDRTIECNTPLGKVEDGLVARLLLLNRAKAFKQYGSWSSAYQLALEAGRLKVLVQIIDLNRNADMSKEDYLEDVEIAPSSKRQAFADLIEALYGSERDRSHALEWSIHEAPEDQVPYVGL